MKVNSKILKQKMMEALAIGRSSHFDFEGRDVTIVLDSLSDVIVLHIWDTKEEKVVLSFYPLYIEKLIPNFMSKFELEDSSEE